MAAPPVSLKDTIVAEFVKAEKAAGAVPAGTSDNTGDAGDQGDQGTDDQGDTGNQDDKPVVDDKKPADKSDEEDDDVVEIDASPEEIRNALNLMRALANPETASQTMQELAQVTGYKLETKKQVQQFERDVKTVLKEKLGDSYDLLSGDKLAEAFDALLEERVGKITKPVLERIENTERAANEQKANAAMDALWARTNITDKAQREKIAGKMVEKMKVLPAGPATDISSYLDDIYSLVTRDTEAARTVKKTVTKIKNNAKDARTSGDGNNGTDDKRVHTGSKLPSIREAVAAAFRGEKLEE